MVIGDTERTRLKDIRALFFGVNELFQEGILSDMEKPYG